MEDLHLDQRIQQFIVTVNHLLKGDSQTRARDLSARNFAVIPLGDNFGMIRWIEGATGLFSIFRKWQQREHAALVLQRKEGAPDIPPPVRPPRCICGQSIQSLASRGSDVVEENQDFFPLGAVMSIVGYVIGLGDRHLDNILIDVEHGEVAHIDFNVCFEKGRNLRIPETVPFR
ncbi:hypothetical protein BASA60_001593 [Batrachochytrium salamandrivorans]|nr:hypothetical protein BASA60_001593 [Batrachochytrium salamandrivorans]